MRYFVLLVLCLALFASENVTARKLCGASLYKKIFKICPLGCTVDDPSLASKLCSFAIDNEELKEMCCPE